MHKYQHRRHNKNPLMAHIIFATKYRKPILVGSIREDVMQSVYDICKRYHWYIKKMETDKNHIHLLIQYNPTDSITKIVSRLTYNMVDMEDASQETFLLLLEGTYFLVRWIFCSIHRGSITVYN